MDRRERFENLPDALIVALRGWQSNLWTALPGIVQSYDPVKQTCEVKPTIMAQVTAKDGSKTWTGLPLLLDCPLHFPSGGGYTLTFPVKKGDECLVVFSSRCIDAWWQNGYENNPQSVLRMHDLSDGFAFVGFNSNPRVITGMSTAAVQLRNDNGTTYVELDGTDVNVVSTTNVKISAPNITLENTGAALKKLVNDTFINLFNTHTHGGVLTGGGFTGVPVISATSANATAITEAE
jgi:hypothetical protein